MPVSAEPLARGRTLFASLLVITAGLVAWWGAWNGPFLFDDHPSFLEHPAMMAGDWWGTALGDHHTPLANRPLTCLSLVVDMKIFGPGPFGPHLVNVLLHLGNALLLLAVVRGVLRSASLQPRFDERSATWIATAIAAIWVVHPLGADAVAYATQRSTVLLATGLLVALLATMRAEGSPRASAWRALAVGATAAAMACKEDAVVVPILIALFERAFLLPSWRALRSRRGFHAALACTWLVLALLVWNGPRNPTVGYDFGQPITAWNWLATEAPVVLHYLRLAVWPQPLRGAYADTLVTEWTRSLPAGIAVVALLVGVVLAWRRAPWLGWLGAMFFLLLAPTSSIMPIVTEITAERRAYLPMLFVIVPAIVALRVAFAAAHRRVVATGIALAIVAALTSVAWTRVAVYGDETRFWVDAYEKRPPESRSFLASQLLGNYATTLWLAGRLDEACAVFDECMKCESPTANMRHKHAASLQYRGRHAEAIAVMRDLVAKEPSDAEYVATLASVLVEQANAEHAKADDPRFEEAERCARRALELAPDRASAWNSLGFLLRKRGQTKDAEAAYRRATELQTERLMPFLARAELLVQLGRADEITAMFDRLLAARATDVRVRVDLAAWLVENRQFDSASNVLQDALRIDPNDAAALAALAALRAKRR